MPPLTPEADDVIIRKGVTADGAGYSGFELTGLEKRLKDLKIERLAVSGIATEYCVRATALDAIQAGFETVLLTDMIRAVQTSETPRVLAELAQAGARAATAAEWLKTL